jgi:hypothetical protein
MKVELFEILPLLAAGVIETIFNPELSAPPVSVPLVPPVSVPLEPLPLGLEGCWQAVTVKAMAIAAKNKRMFFVVRLLFVNIETPFDLYF